MRSTLSSLAIKRLNCTRLAIFAGDLHRNARHKALLQLTNESRNCPHATKADHFSDKSPTLLANK